MSRALLVILTVPLVAYSCWLLASVVESTLGARKLPLSRRAEGDLRSRVVVAVLYATCDDFNPDACASMLHQTGAKTRLFLLDDSTSEASRQRVDAWALSVDEEVCVVRRRDRSGFKAGNINNWLTEFGDPLVYPYVMLADADQRIPRDFVRRLLDQLELSEGSWFVQATHDGTASIATDFQALMFPQVECEWRYHVPARALSGIPLMLGHGVLIETRRLHEIGGVPRHMSEDLAVTIAFADRGGSGVLASHVSAHEEFPRDYRSYWNRRRRWVQADGELLWMAMAHLKKAPLTSRAKLDLAARQCRLAVASAYWLLLVLLCILLLQGDVVLPRWPGLSWGFLLLGLSPILPVMSFRHIPVAHRIRFVAVAVYVAASTISLYPHAVYRGLRGRTEWAPTGSWSSNRQRSTGGPVHACWDIASGLLFCVCGLWSGTLSLTAVGVAVLMAPQLRGTRSAYWIFFGTTTFWTLLGWQVVTDLTDRSVELEHLLPIAGLAIMLL